MQKGNPLLKHVRNVKWVFADVVCDYVLGDSSCALYLRYFQLQVACPPPTIFAHRFVIFSAVSAIIFSIRNTCISE